MPPGNQTERRFRERANVTVAIAPRCLPTGCPAPLAPRGLTASFDPPHLLGIAASAPYLHDGRAKTLEELWTRYQTNDLHGVSSHWSKHQLNDLIEYLKTL